MDALPDLLRPQATTARPAGVPPGLVARRGPEAPAPRARVPAGGGGARLGELLGGLSRALDMAGGQPAGHAVHACWIGQQLGRAIGLNAIEMRELYYTTLLKDSGGSTTAGCIRAVFLADDLAFKRARRTAGTSLTGQLNVVVRHTGAGAGLAQRCRALFNAVQNCGEIDRALAEERGSRGARIARQLGLGEDVAEAIQSLDEHWDGSGHPHGLAGNEIPLYARIALLAQSLAGIRAGAGAPSARELVARRRGRWFDPRLADLFDVLARDPAFRAGLASDDLAARVVEMAPPQPVDDDALDAVARAFGEIADAKSAWTDGHSARVALVADGLGVQLGLNEGERRWLRRGALLHDIGKLGVSNQILDKPGPLTACERAAMQRHAQDAERILARIPSFGALARVVGAHHEKLDGSGYPRGLDARHIRLETRILTAADRLDALTSDRPSRAALPIDQALQVLRDGIGVAIDADCFAALERWLKADQPSSCAKSQDPRRGQ
jgi:HD-GYP domain-containing protein (c-di-GMP phosphodiesterase class II)